MGLWQALRCVGCLALAQAVGAAAQDGAAKKAPVASPAGEAAGAKAARWWSALLTMATGAPNDAAAHASAGDGDADADAATGDAADDADVASAGGAADTVNETADVSAGAGAPVDADVDEANVDDTSSDALIAWVRSSPGGVFHEALRVQRPARGPRGIFAVDAISSGAVLTRVPWDRLVSAPSPGLCATTAKTRDELALGADSVYAPYMESMRGYDPNLPCFWPADALSLVRNLPPYDWTRHVSWYIEHCGGSVSEETEVWAVSLNVARACSANKGEIMAPLYDLHNHRNGKWTNTLVEVLWGVSLTVRASRDIAEGDEILLSYGLLTPALFRDYGFVEHLPQRWDSFPGGHDFELLETGSVQWHSKTPDRQSFLFDVQGVFDELARKVDFNPSKQADDALRYRASLRFALDLAISRTTFADETMRNDL
ncbi:hypothetical protein M885DRAFT_587337 [Pelagophyceae sp. CCMP2097]|nr:hypothetical protein M885DRAFT_587337 [Pelagophyceae sp. CCMP2097]